MAGEERAIMGAVHHGGVRDAEHQCHIGAGTRGDPVLVHFIGQIALQRRDQHEFAAALAQRDHVAMFGVLADAAAGNARVLGIHAAEGENNIGVLDDFIPADIAAGHIFVIAEDVRNENRRRAGRVAVDRRT
jgi:hypothetical protein